MKPVISWRDSYRLLSMVWTNHETKESLFFAGLSVPSNRILGDGQTACSVDMIFCGFVFFGVRIEELSCSLEPF